MVTATFLAHQKYSIQLIRTCGKELPKYANKSVNRRFSPATTHYYYPQAGSPRQLLPLALA